MLILIIVKSKKTDLTTTPIGIMDAVVDRHSLFHICMLRSKSDGFPLTSAQLVPVGSRSLFAACLRLLFFFASIRREEQQICGNREVGTEPTGEKWSSRRVAASSTGY